MGRVRAAAPEVGGEPPGRRRVRRRRVRRSAGVLVLAGLGWVGVSLGSALAAPTSDSTAATVAEWGRDHHLGIAVGTLEKLQYRLDPPKVGGAPDASQLAELSPGPGSPPATATGPRSPSGTRSARPPRGPSAAPTATPAPVHAPLAPQVSPALAGEGVFRPEVVVDGSPVLQAAYLRPDATHTSYLTGVVWIDHRAARWELHPGYEDPGNLSRWDQPDSVPPSQRADLLATFNGGFKTNESRGGFHENGHTAGALLSGAASLVIYRDGHADIGSWGSEVSMTPQVAAVRQNLRLMIDHGRIAADLQDDVRSNWGLTLGGGYAVWRSGVGVTAAGDTVVVMGNALTAQSLADLLLAAGSVRGMEMDINPEWMSFMWYTPGTSPTMPTPHKLVPFRRDADRYFSANSRDFFAVHLRD